MLHLNLLQELSGRISACNTTRSSRWVFLNIGGSEGRRGVCSSVCDLNSLLLLCKGHSDDSSGLSLLLTSPICFHTQVLALLIPCSSLLIRHLYVCFQIKGFTILLSACFIFLVKNMRYKCYLNSMRYHVCGVVSHPFPRVIGWTWERSALINMGSHQSSCRCAAVIELL